MDSHKIEFECIQWIKHYLADYIINGKSTANVLRSVRDKSFTIPVGGTVEISGVLWRQASASFTPISQKDSVTRQSASNWHQAQGETTLALWYVCLFDTPTSRFNMWVASARYPVTTSRSHLALAIQGTVVSNIYGIVKLILCTCKIVHLGNIKLKKIGSKPKHQCENKKCNGDGREWTKWNGRLVQPRQSIFKVMHSVLLPSTPSKPSTHHALISIHIYIDIEIMYTINTTSHASNIDKESISGGVTELPHWFWEPAAVAVLNFKMENVYQNLSPKQ